MQHLWQVIVYAHEEWPATALYAHDNALRPDNGHCIFQYVEAGLIEIVDGHGVVHQSPANTAFLFRYGERSLYRLPANNRQPYLTTWLNFEGAGLREHWDLIREANGPVIAMSSELLTEMRRLGELSRPEVRCDPVTMASACQAFILRLVRNARERQRTAQAPVERAIDDLLANPAAPWSLKQLADDHGVSREHLTRAFQARVGSAPAAWLNEARLAKALHLLADSDMALHEVARLSGFGSTHTMARVVRTATGFSPLHHRSEHRS